MPSKIQEVAAMLDGLDKLELECLKSLVGQAIEARPAQGSCKFLALPAELRDLIYYHAAINYLSRAAYDKNPGLLGASKQLRSEFRDVLYSDNLVSSVEIAALGDDSADPYEKSAVWTPVQNSKLRRALIGRVEGVKLYPFTDESRAREMARLELSIYEGQRQRDRSQTATTSESPSGFGVLKIAENRKRRFAPWNATKDVLEKYGLEDELPSHVVDE